MSRYNYRPGVTSSYYTVLDTPEKFLMPMREEKLRFHSHTDIYSTSSITKVVIEESDNCVYLKCVDNNKKEISTKRFKIKKGVNSNVNN